MKIVSKEKFKVIVELEYDDAVHISEALESWSSQAYDYEWDEADYIDDLRHKVEALKEAFIR